MDHSKFRRTQINTLVNLNAAATAAATKASAFLNQGAIKACFMEQADNETIRCSCSSDGHFNNN
ncbi:MAG: hypothetical protein ACI89Z_000118 [Porticoccus sp.]|jgi:hypothetical protein